MSAERFPHAVTFTRLHMFTTFEALRHFLLAPTSHLSNGAGNAGEEIGSVPMVCVCGSFPCRGAVFSNGAFLYGNSMNLQFMKKVNIVLMFFPLLIGLQVATRWRDVNSTWILGGSLMAVSGQIVIASTGSAFQLASHFLECIKSVMRVWIAKSHLKLDALTCTTFLASTCSVYFSDRRG